MQFSRTLVAPSILSADFKRLGQEIDSVISAGADMIHLDVMDGHFVPNISFGLPILHSIAGTVKVPIDCHLMISNPESFVEKFASGGADIITVHAEASNHLERLLSHIKGLGKKSGLAFNPHTDVEILKYVVHATDLVLIMTVNPGFGGQEFIPATVPKIRRVAEIARAAGRSIMIQVDGGITSDNKNIVIGAGANVIVAGSFVFSKQDYRASVESLR